MKSQIHIGHTQDKRIVTLDLPVLAETHAFLNATSGGGKSSFMRMLAERAAKQTQIIVIDWEGEYSTLREKLDLLIVANTDGADIPADPRTAKLLARRLLETRVSAVIDLSELEGDAKNLYCAHFLMAMIDSPRSLWHPVLVFVDELQELAPQSAGAGRRADDPIQQSLTALKAMAARGRKRGFGLIAATQRITKVHKDVISTLKNQFTGQTVLDVDRDRAADNLGFTKQGSLSLRDLERGDWYGFGPAINQRGVVLFHADQGETTHLGSGQRHTLVIPAPTEAIRKSLAQFADLPAEFKREQDELATLRAENVRMKKELAARPTVTAPAPQPETKIESVEIPVLREGEAAQLLSVNENAARLALELQAAIAQLAGVAQTIKQTVDTAALATKQANARTTPIVSPRVTAPPQAPRPFTVRIVDENTSALGAGEIKVLRAIAQYPDGVTRDTLTVLTGYKRSSRDTYIQRLSARGFVSVERERVFATEQGIAELGANFEPLPTGDALQAYWLARLTGGEKEILRVALEAHPHWLDRERVSEMTGYKRSSRDTYIQRLTARRLLDTKPAAIRASETLFD